MHAQPTRADMASAPTPATGSRTGATPGQADAKPRPGPGDQRQRIPRPLPDPTAIRLCAVPDSAPPYDTEPGDGGGTAGGAELVRPDPGTLMCAASRSVTGATGEGKPAARPAPGPGSAEWPSRFAQVLAETLAGARPPAQLTPWTTERARSQIRRLGPLLTAQQRPVIQRIVTSLPTAGVMEMSVVVGLGSRVRGLAVRLEQTGPPPLADGRAGEGRWLCTAVEAA
ncbi:MAG TPA: Rv3235 family protein [Streptosporangiaceae bacterium]|jgi:hypothetical protein|nr:Rv3235 family protein [Streptosporangiaceae bacterium]